MVKKINNTKNGFTIIESLISLILLAIFMTGGMQFYLNAQKVVSLASHKKFAMEFANSILENLKNIPYLSLTPVSETEILEPEDPRRILIDLPPSNVFLSATKAVAISDLVNYKQVDVSVRWREAGETGARAVRFTTYIAP